jgi:1,2-dihydroxy-3-keto-5-methylthiopentene dioxygenase
MRAYYFDNIPGDQRLPHDSGYSVSDETLRALHVLHWSIPIDDTESWEHRIDEVAKERGYKDRDIINVTKKALGDMYETKLKEFFEESVTFFAARCTAKQAFARR